MTTCGQALEMVRMAMAEAGFPNAPVYVNDESAEFPPDEPCIKLPWRQPDDVLVAAHRATALVRHHFGGSVVVCLPCFVHLGREFCEHMAEVAS